MPEQHHSFDPMQVQLEKRNLIQASAGTGKTYSLAFLTVRLVVEKGMGINEVLLVTFTKAAVAELETRVRSFVRLALKRARGEEIEDKTLSKLVEGYLKTMDRETVIDRLNAAQLLLDETAVMTIHGFCQQVLKEYAFETGQIFGSETMSPDEMNEVIEDGVYEFWRRHVTVLEPQLLEKILGIEVKGKPMLSTEHLMSVVKAGMGGKIPLAPEPAPADFLSYEGQKRFFAKVQSLSEKSETIRQNICAALNDPKLHAAILKNHHAKNLLQEHIDAQDWKKMLDALCEKCKKNPPAYVAKIFGPLADEIIALAEDNEEEIQLRTYIAWIGEAAFQQVKKVLHDRLNERGLITFDEMIRLTYDALQGPGKDMLVKAMRAKYKAVFCDEYQDTDRYQHEIFKTLFYDDTVLFFVGDSKQSIYAFRKADLNTYFDAEQTVDRVHQMNTNHRSTEAFINAMNRFFLPSEDFSTFAFKEGGPAIHYTKVDSPKKNRRGQMTLDGQPVVPMLISRVGSKDPIPGAVKDIILHLKHGNYMIDGRKLDFSDIGILVRTNGEGRKIKRMLSAHRIPCISIDDTKIFSTNEAKEVYLILLGIYEMTRGSINRALLTTIGGYDIEKLQTSNEEDILNRFRAYHDVWLKDGVYVMLHKFYADHGLYDLRNSADAEGGDRIIANAVQLAELVHRISERKNFDMLEQIQWMKKGMDGEIREGDEYLQRLESDEQAVKIITVHKAKGLEYNVAICPHLDMNNDSSFYVTGSFRDVDGEYYVMDKKLMSKSQEQMYLEQSEQENRRLLYVAITRARYQCYIISSDWQNGNSALRQFRNALDAVADLDPQLIELNWPLPSGLPPYVPNAAEDRVRYETAPRFQANLRERYWRRTSYSGLTPDHATTPLKRYEGLSKDLYDQFVFRDLVRGAQTGNLLHYIFEKIDFTTDTYWTRMIERGLKRAGATYDPALLVQLLHATLGADLGQGFKLSEIPQDKKLAELEFDFPLRNFKPSDIASLSTPEIPLLTGNGGELEGMMNGKIDLVFQAPDGKYWILDWKSNWLGERPEDYAGPNLSAAMAENNYHLQYHIYTLALKRFLSLHDPGFDYERDFGGCLYIFLRGARAGKGYGVYHHKPAAEVIDSLQEFLCKPIAGSLESFGQNQEVELPDAKDH